jgi:membrane protein implicated in regulation of membrane protease activity
VNKGPKLALFVLAGTLFNLVSTVVFFLALLGLYSITLGRLLPQSAITWAVLASFILSLVGAVFAYKKVLEFARKKYDLDSMLEIKKR